MCVYVGMRKALEIRCQQVTLEPGALVGKVWREIQVKPVSALQPEYGFSCPHRRLVPFEMPWRHSFASSCHSKRAWDSRRSCVTTSIPGVTSYVLQDLSHPWTSLSGQANSTLPHTDIPHQVTGSCTGVALKCLLVSASQVVSCRGL